MRDGLNAFTQAVDCARRLTVKSLASIPEARQVILACLRTCVPPRAAQPARLTGPEWNASCHPCDVWDDRFRVRQLFVERIGLI